MKVFEVITEHLNGLEIIETVQYVSHEKNNILAVTEYFTKRCEEIEHDLKSVREVLIIVEHIKDEETNI